MRKALIIIVGLMIVGCGNQDESYPGFTSQDFSGETIHYVQPSGETPGVTAKMEFLDDGQFSLQKTNPMTIEKGTWEIIDGKLHIYYWRFTNLEKVHAVFTLSSDNQDERYYAATQVNDDGSSFPVALFYDPANGYADASLFFLNKRQP